MAKSAVCHSGQLGASRPTRSPGLYAKFHQGVGQAGNASQEFLTRDRFPALGAPEELRPRRREFVDSLEESRRERAVVHARV